VLFLPIIAVRMNNRFSPAPDPASLQPNGGGVSPGTPPILDSQGADLRSQLIRFSAFALTATFVFILAFRLLGLNAAKTPAAARQESPAQEPAPLYTPPSTDQSVSNQGTNPLISSYVQPLATSNSANGRGASGSKLLRLEDGKYNEAVRQWLGNESPRATINVPVDGIPSQAPVPRYLPSPTTATSQQ
jgi:hypothetical protein